MNSETIESNTAGVINAAALDMKLEVVIIPVSDVDRSKAFYASLGWRLDADFRFDNGFRLLQFTPAGSPCSVQFGSKLTAAEPGSARDSYLIVSDISAARSEIASRGVHISEVFHPAAPGAQFQPEGAHGRVVGTDPNHTSYRSFATFSDPDGNRWLMQEVAQSSLGIVHAKHAQLAIPTSRSAHAGKRPGRVLTP